MYLYMYVHILYIYVCMYVLWITRRIKLYHILTNDVQKEMVLLYSLSFSVVAFYYGHAIFVRMYVCMYVCMYVWMYMYVCTKLFHKI